MRPLDQNQRRAIGLTRRNKKTGLLTMPGYGALNDLVNRIDPVEPARALNAWLTENCDLFPKSLALDGKDPGAKGRLGGIVTLCFHAKPGGHAGTRKRGIAILRCAGPGGNCLAIYFKALAVQDLGICRNPPCR